MMQPSNGAAVPPQMSMDPQQQYQQHQYQQPPPQHQQWMTMPPQQQQPPQHQAYQSQPPPMWAQQMQPPHQQPQSHGMQMQQQHYPSAGAQQTTSNELKSLWIGDLQYWMDENYLWNCFVHAGEVSSVKVIRNRQSAQPEGYGFIEFASHAAAEKVLQSYNGTQMPNSEQLFRLNWASLGSGEKRDDTPDYTLFVGDLAADVTDYLLQETFKANYSSVKGAKVVTDRMTGRSKGYGFVKFADENEQSRAMTEMNGVMCSSRPMRIGAAATKKSMGAGQQYQKAPYQFSQGHEGETDPNNTTIFVGGLDEGATDEHLRQVFGQYGELVHVKIPAGKRCGFVQFADRGCAEQALSALNGHQIGNQNVRLSWGRSPSNKQTPSDQSNWNGGAGGAGGDAYYGGYGQQGGGGGGYEGYGSYGQPQQQDPNMYYGAGYNTGYGNYQPPHQ